MRKITFFFILVLSINLFASTSQSTLIDKNKNLTFSLSVSPLRLIRKSFQVGIIFPHNGILTLGSDYYYIKDFNCPMSHILDLDYGPTIALPFVKWLEIRMGISARFTYSIGYPGTNDSYDWPGDIYSNKKKSIFKFGLGLNCKTKFNITNRLYLESGFKLGGYLSGKSGQFHGGFLSGLYDQDTHLYIAIDLFRMGYKFGNIPHRLNPPTSIDKGIGIGFYPQSLLYGILIRNFSILFLDFSINYFSSSSSMELDLAWKDFTKAYYDNEDAQMDDDRNISKALLINFRFRKYLTGNKLKTYYVPALRYVHLKGLKEDAEGHEHNHYIDKVGLGIGLGLNFSITKHWNIDCHSIIGGYIIGNIETFTDYQKFFMDNESIFWDISLFKMIYKF